MHISRQRFKTTNMRSVNFLQRFLLFNERLNRICARENPVLLPHDVTLPALAVVRFLRRPSLSSLLERFGASIRAFARP